MISFCPNCSNMLLVERGSDLLNQFVCPTCPYEFKVDGFKMRERQEFTRKQVDDVLGGAGAWDNVDQTTVQCPIDNCDSAKAYFFQLQIRSADEPMTTFYKCVTCSNQWREN